MIGGFDRHSEMHAMIDNQFVKIGMLPINMIEGTCLAYDKKVYIGFEKMFTCRLPLWFFQDTETEEQCWIPSVLLET